MFLGVLHKCKNVLLGDWVKCKGVVGMRGVGWRTPLHLREQNQRKLIQIMPGDF